MPKLLNGPGWTPPNTTAAGTGAATAETDLQSVVIPAAALVSGAYVRIRASGTITGANGTRPLGAAPATGRNEAAARELTARGSAHSTSRASPRP
jgi:hypothetical protein